MTCLEPFCGRFDRFDPIRCIVQNSCRGQSDVAATACATAAATVAARLRRRIGLWRRSPFGEERRQRWLLFRSIAPRALLGWHLARTAGCVLEVSRQRQNRIANFLRNSCRPCASETRRDALSVRPAVRACVERVENRSVRATLPLLAPKRIQLYPHLPACDSLFDANNVIPARVQV